MTNYGCAGLGGLFVVIARRNLVPKRRRSAAVHDAGAWARSPRTWRSVRHPCLTYRVASCRPGLATNSRKPHAKFWPLGNQRRSLPPGRDARLYGRQGCRPPLRQLSGGLAQGWSCQPPCSSRISQALVHGGLVRRYCQAEPRSKAAEVRRSPGRWRVGARPASLA